MSTTIIKRISVGTGIDLSAALSAWPATVAAIQALGFTTLGSVQNGDSGDLDSDAVKIKPRKEGVSIDPPGAQAQQGYILRKSGVASLEFSTYDTDEAVFALDSCAENISSPGDLPMYDKAGTQTYRQIVVETETGLYIDVYPRVMLSITDESIGYGPGDNAVGKFKFTAEVLDSKDPAFPCKSGRLRIYLTGDES